MKRRKQRNSSASKKARLADFSRRHQRVLSKLRKHGRSKAKAVADQAAETVKYTAEISRKALRVLADY